MCVIKCGLWCRGYGYDLDYVSESELSSKLEKTEWQVLIFVLTGFFEIFLLWFTQLMSKVTLAEKIKTKNLKNSSQHEDQ